MLSGSVGAGWGVIRSLPARRPKAALMPPGHHLDTASMPPNLATNDPGNIPKYFVFQMFYKHFAPDTDGVQAAASGQRPGGVRAAFGRRSGDVRAVSKRHPGGGRTPPHPAPSDPGIINKCMV